MKEYTLIFCFDEKLENVLLINKVGGPFPGKLNGIGGKLEPGESPHSGVLRELNEEAGILKEDIKCWQEAIDISFASLDDHIFVYYAIIKNPDFSKVLAHREGEVKWYNIEYSGLFNLNNDRLSPNVAYFVSYIIATLKKKYDNKELCNQEYCTLSYFKE